ncbi:MAG: bifunctional diaminohydroxyphosphoribosylaminopyrimidine deaminase/5-amino-6-(5-phosphoribosylamino)uracil reductase RibD [Verrucomicrobiales bacterium]|nr:bifunctional diaminohydroxyphosphoribosylaminopyrimidine deaminase/5-amino-6-(5-phosphoribosylamino)uracil reductase RibD [Verrucomicrobiales bacterium]
MNIPDTDEPFMRLAIDLGFRGLGMTSPNPAVGAIVVRDGVVIGEGWHHKAGGPHAEVHAIRDAHEKHGPESTRGATIYVTLEPCSTHGRTPPCTSAIQEAGISRIVVGSTDPNPDHVGGGFALLRSAGIEVVTGIAEKEADHLLRFFRKHITTGRPWVIGKTAATLSGHTTLPQGEGQWISSPTSREDVQRIRRQCDAILIGGETFRIDNPSLTLRGKWAEGRDQPRRIVLSSDSQLVQTHHLFADEFRDRTTVHAGVTLLESLTKLGSEGVTSVLLESGGRLLAHALEAGLIDELVLYLAPIIGGGGSKTIPVQDFAARLDDVDVTMSGPDIRIIGYPAPLN